MSVFFLLLFLVFEIAYFTNTRSVTLEHQDIKKEIVSLISLPDISVSTEAKYIRNRSLSDVFSLFSESPELLEYFPTTYIYAPSSNLRNNPSRIVIE